MVGVGSIEPTDYCNLSKIRLKLNAALRQTLGRHGCGVSFAFPHPFRYFGNRNNNGAQPLLFPKFSQVSPRKQKDKKGQASATRERGPLLERSAFWVIASFVFFYLFFLRVTGNEWVLSPPYQDIYRISYPFIAFLDRCVDAGFLPLWNPYQFSGHPFAANGEAGVFYLPKLLVCLLSDGTSLLGWHAMLHAWIGWLAMFFLLKEFRRGTAACVLGASGWVFSGLGITLLPWVSFTASTIVWYPLAILVLKRASKVSSPLSVALLGLCVALEITAGMLAYVVPFLMILAAYGIYLFFSTTGRDERKRIAFTLVGGVTLGIAVSGIHLLPTIEMMLHSQRLMYATGETEKYAFSLPKWWSEFKPGSMLGQFFFPAGTADETQREMPFLSFPILFAGILSSVRALRRGAPAGGEAHFWVWLALVGFFFVFNNPLYWFAVSKAPILVEGHLITKGTMFFTLAMIVLAARLIDSEEAKRFKLPWPLGLFGIGVVSYILFSGPSGPKLPDELRSQHLILFLVTVAVFTLLWWLWLKDRIRRALFSALTALLVVVSGSFAAWWYLYTNNFSMPARDYYQPNQLTEFLTREGRTELFRILPIKVNMYPNTETVYGLYGVNGYCPAHWSRYSEVMKVADADGDPYLRPNFSQSIALDQPRTAILALLNTKYVISREGIQLVPNYFPRAWLSHTYEVVTDPTRRLERLKQARFSRDTVMFEEEPGLRDWLGRDTAETIRVAAYNPNSVELAVDAASNSLLALSEINFPGWRATVDGNEVPIYTAYHVLRSIAVPAGKHIVRFTYFPQSAQIGLGVSGVGFVALIVLVGVHFRRRRAPDRSQDSSALQSTRSTKQNF
jgi:hypothetical protein